MENEEISTIIREAVVETFNLEQPITNDNISFKDDLDADSLDMVTLTLDLEEKFSGEIDEEIAESFVTVSDVISYVTNQELNKEDD